MNIVLPSRKYQIYFEHRPQYLYVYVACETIDLGMAKRYWIDILALLHRRKYESVLIEKDIPVKLPPHDLFTLVSELAHSGCTRVAFAVVDRYHDRERAEFEEMVGTNRGLRIKVTDDLAFAEKWLSSNRITRHVNDEGGYPGSSIAANFI